MYNTGGRPCNLLTLCLEDVDQYDGRHNSHEVALNRQMLPDLASSSTKYEAVITPESEHLPPGRLLMALAWHGRHATKAASLSPSLSSPLLSK